MANDALEVEVETVSIVGRFVGRFDAAASVAGDEIVEDAVWNKLLESMRSVG